MNLYVLTIDKGPERYVFKWSDPQAAAVIQTACRFASDPELSFTWADAMVVAKYARRRAPSQPFVLDGHGPGVGCPTTDKSPLAAWCQAILHQVASTIGIGWAHPRGTRDDRSD